VGRQVGCASTYEFGSVCRRPISTSATRRPAKGEERRRQVGVDLLVVLDLEVARASVDAEIEEGLPTDEAAGCAEASRRSLGSEEALF